tara:strand:- start:422 stop:814 length:393 start_codon:yes stop_codon:yes gene_type:complete
MKNVFLIILLLSVSNLTTYWYSTEIKSILTRSEKLIISKIQLETNCELMNEAFMVVDLTSEKRVSFNSSTAYIQTFKGNFLQIQMNPKFSDVTSNFKPHAAKKKMVIEIDCKVSNKLKNTLDSLRNTFKN